jgi:hypothetical protein
MLFARLKVDDIVYPKERRLPAEAVPERRKAVQEEVDRLTLDLRYLAKWKWLRRRQVRWRLHYLEGLAEGMRLASPPYPPSDPGKGCC